MAIWDIIPTCDDKMSCYTLCVFAVFVTGWIIYIRNNSKEFRRIEHLVKNEIKKLEVAIDGHDDYIDKTTTTIGNIQIQLAIQKTSMTDIKEDIAEIKKDIKTLLNRST